MEKNSLMLKIFLCVSLGSLIWLGSFVALSEAFEVKTEPYQTPQITSEPSESLFTAYAKSFTIVAAEDEEHSITEMSLVYMDCTTDTLVVLTVPTNTKIEFSAAAYEVLRVYRPDMPKLFMISELAHSFSEELFCMAAEEAIGGLLGVRPKSCVLVSEATYHALFEQTEQGARLKKPKSVKDTIAAVYRYGISDRSLSEALLYTESYLDLKEIYYGVIPGENLLQEYRPDGDKMRQMAESFAVGSYEEYADTRENVN